MRLTTTEIDAIEAQLLRRGHTLQQDKAGVEALFVHIREGEREIRRAALEEAIEAVRVEPEIDAYPVRSTIVVTKRNIADRIRALMEKKDG